MRQDRKKHRAPHSLLAGQNSLKSNLFCQENLTKTPISLENRDTYLSLLKMGIDKGKALGAMMLGALAVDPALAEEQQPSVQLAGMTSGQVTDCVAFVKQQRALAAEHGNPMSRTAAMAMLGQCENGELEKIIAEQQRVIAALRNEIKAIQLEIVENGQIIDANGRAIAKIVAINGQLIIRKQELDTEIASSRARQDELVRQAEAILQRLATS
ncbi:hypothetical protein [Cohaesibacter gelatinilyticus]|uniref:Uncharacterized protein n=1 Tax=Cohaesibacter gelatinilyticus TaxID=372072 RepID=A0A285PJL7_9HYPH|nr:hypothetical protein [Cohaesibacter gelatinilyticus]SNZ20071.1 hypothetical protein SAMN06265368_3170 [Cohaesibacter gelatinilyticus]